MKKKISLFALALALIFIPFSCNKEKEREEPDFRTLEYSLNVTNDNYVATTVLDGIGDTKIANIRNLPPWVGEITREEALLGGSMVLSVPVKADPSLSGVRTAEIQIEMTSGATAILTLNQRAGLPIGFNAGESPSVNTAFEENWWAAQTVYLVTKYENINGRDNCTIKEIPLPWNTTSTGTHNNLPQGEMENMIQHKDQWELAFNTTGIKLAECVHLNYFGLYNTQTGLMRVFYYWPVELLPPSGANDHMWYVRFRGTQAQHNSTQFAVPYNHRLDYNDEANAIFTQIAGLYRTTAFTEKIGENLTIVPEQGWWAFDVDISAMRGKSFFDDYEPITIGLHLFDTQNLVLESVLKGSIKGDLDGSMNLNALKPSSATDAGKIVSSLCGGGASFLSNKFFLEQITSAGADSPGWGWFSLSAGSVVSVAGNLFKEYGKSGGASQDDIEKLGHINANLNLDLDATMSTKGVITSQRSHAVPEVTLPREYFRLADMKNTTKADDNAGVQMGNGLWNISEDPVVYIVKDAFWTNKATMSYYSRTELGWYRQGQKGVEYDISTSPYQLGMRLISFFDPTSIGPVVINEDLFGHPEECHVSVSYGIYPGSKAGYTDLFREATSLKYNPITLSNTSKDQKVSTAKVPGTSPAPFKVFKMSYNNNLFKVQYENPYPEIIGNRLSEQELSGTQTKNKETTAYTYYRRYYGSSLFYSNPEANYATVDQVQYVADPQIFLPYDEERRVITDPDIPDMVVSVKIAFKSQGIYDTEPTWKTYTLRYLPRIEFIKANEVSGIANRINSSINGGQPSYVTYQTFADHNRIVQDFSKEISSQLSK